MIDFGILSRRERIEVRLRRAFGLDDWFQEVDEITDDFRKKAQRHFQLRDYNEAERYLKLAGF